MWKSLPLSIVRLKQFDGFLVFEKIESFPLFFHRCIQNLVISGVPQNFLNKFLL